MALITTLSMLFEVETTEQDNNGAVYFVFERSPDLDAALKKYWCGQETVEPQKFFAQLKIIKTRIYAER